MKELNFDTGIVTYTVNKNCEVSFNPTDAFFIDRILDTFSMLEQKGNSYKEEASQISDPKEVFNLMRKVDGEMRECLNSAFGTDICTPVFGHANVFSEGDGLPIWINFLLCVMDECNEAISNMGKSADARIAKYTEKYRKRRK